mgnify:CR=1 FL=1
MSGNYRPTERQTGIANWSETLPLGDAGNATHAADGARAIVLECVAATASPAGTVEGKTAAGVWMQIKSYQLTSGTLTARAAGATITLATGDLLYIPVGGFTHARFKRASGTSMTWTARTFEDMADTFTVLNGGATEAKQDVQIAEQSAGSSSYSAISAAAVLSAAIKASPGVIRSIEVFSLDATPVFVSLYNQTGAPGSGDAATIVRRLMVPANATAALGAGFVHSFGRKGLACSAGIGIRAKTGIADNDTGALSANEVLFNVTYD